MGCDNGPEAFLLSICQPRRGEAEPGDQLWCETDPLFECFIGLHATENIRLIPNFKRRAILRPALPLIIHPRRRNITGPRSRDRPLYALRGGRRGAGASSTDAKMAANIERGF